MRYQVQGGWLRKMAGAVHFDFRFGFDRHLFVVVGTATMTTSSRSRYALLCDDMPSCAESRARGQDGEMSYEELLRISLP